MSIAGFSAETHIPPWCQMLKEGGGVRVEQGETGALSFRLNFSMNLKLL